MTFDQYYQTMKEHGIGELFFHYDNIKKVKLKKSLFFKNCGTVKIYVKKGWSMNYSLQWIAEPEKVYALIVENLNRNAGS